jgi:hypothetical protein
MTRLGYQIPNFTYPGAAPIDLFPTVVRQAREAEASGFDTVLARRWPSTVRRSDASGTRSW